MTDKQPEALRLADLLNSAEAHCIDGDVYLLLSPSDADLAAYAIRRLHEENKALRARLAQPEPEAKYSDIVSDGGLDPRNKFDAQHEPIVEPVLSGLPMVIAGALFDFAGYLTTRKEIIKVGASANASPMVELLKEWAAIRGLPLDEAAVLSWQETITPEYTGLHDMNKAAEHNGEEL